MITFFRMPRTASSYLHRLFRKTGDVKVIEHITLEQAQSEMEVYKNSFCFVRNPYQRFHSAYNYIKNNGNGNKIDTIGGKILREYSQEEFLEKIDTLLKKYPNALKHFIPQYKWITKDGRCLIDNITKYEDIEAEYNHLKDKLGFKDITPEFKKTEPYSVYYPELIENFYYMDFELYGYKKN